MKTTANHKVSFVIPLKPISAGRPRVFAGHVGYSKTYQKFSREVKKWLEKNDDLYLAIKKKLASCNVFSIKIISVFASKNKRLWGLPQVSKPDLDNLLKAQIDRVIAQVMPQDDSHIGELTTKKVYGRDSQIKVEISGYFIDIKKQKQLYKNDYQRKYNQAHPHKSHSKNPATKKTKAKPRLSIKQLENLKKENLF